MPSRPHRVDWSVRLYSALIKAYPAAFRNQYADEMTRVFGELLADARRQRGTIGLVTTWFRVLGDLLWSAPREHVRAWKNLDGGTAVNIKSLLTREVSSDEADCRLGQVVTYGVSLLVLVLGIGKFTSMRLTEPQLVFGILLVVALALQCVGMGMLVPISKWKNRSKYYISAGQIAACAVPVLALVPGVWTLGSMGVTEYEFMFGLLLMFVVMASLVLIASILPLVDAHRAEQRQQMIDANV
jgi:hypothetical protein